MQTRSKNIHIALILSAVIFLNGCAFKGSVGENFYKPGVKLPEKLPFKVAFVQDREFRALKYSEDSYTVDLQPGFSNTLKAGLASVFQGVRTKDESEKTSGVDYLVYPEVNIKRSLEDTTLNLKLVFKDADTGIEILAIQRGESVRDGDRKIIGQAFISFAAFLSVGLLYPLIPQHNGSLQVEYIEKLMSRSVDYLMNDIIIRETSFEDEDGMPKRTFRNLEAHPENEKLIKMKKAREKQKALEQGLGAGDESGPSR